MVHIYNYTSLSIVGIRCGHVGLFPVISTQLDVESVEDDHDNITEEESIIQSALSHLDQR
jgi:hypothetical protein